MEDLSEVGSHMASPFGQRFTAKSAAPGTKSFDSNLTERIERSGEAFSEYMSMSTKTRLELDGPSRVLPEQRRETKPEDLPSECRLTLAILRPK